MICCMISSLEQLKMISPNFPLPESEFYVKKLFTYDPWFIQVNFTVFSNGPTTFIE